MKLNEKNYVERDISWMAFNHRVLEQAQREDVPLLERLSFLGIYSNNLDEFFRVRVATLNRIVEYADKSNKSLRDRSEKTLKTVMKLNGKYVKEFATAVRNVTEALHQENIHLLNEKELNDEQQQFVRQYCQQQLAGNLSPIWLSAVKKLNASADDTIYMAVRLQQWDDQKKKPLKDFALIEIPVSRYGRFVQLPSAEEVDFDAEGIEQRTTSHYIMYLDDVLRCALPRAYTDLMLMTARKPIVSDVARVFQFIEHPYLPVRFKELLVSPNDMKRQLLALINQEIKNHNQGLPSGILAKVNHVTDEEVVKKIYEAASAGVKVRLLVRGNCSLIADLPELNGNLQLNHIIDRYLEHSRILIFANGSDLEHPEIIEEDGSHRQFKVFIGSADWMPRNLDHRIEVYTPIYDNDIKREARLIVEYGMQDDKVLFRSQQALYERYSTNNQQ